MNVKGLNDALRNFYKTESLEKLSNKRVAVEGSNWAKKLSLNEPLQSAMGGVPLKFDSEVNNELQKWESAHITPLFVFSGLSIKRDDEVPVNQPGNFKPKKGRREKGWEMYRNGDKDGALKIFQEKQDGVGINFIRNIIPILVSLNVQFIHAPYLSWPQMVFFERGKLVEECYGGLELLLFGANRVITDINFEKRTFTYVDKKQFMDHYIIKDDQFLDACLLSGFSFPEYLKSLPPFISSSQAIFPLIVDKLRPFDENAALYALNYATSFHGDKDRYAESYFKLKCMIANHPILEPSCQCEPLNKENCPNNLTEIFGHRLPPEIYFFLSQGVVAAQAINNLIHGHLYEAPPLLDSLEYHKTLDDLLEIRTKTLAVISTFLHDTISLNSVHTTRWFAPESRIELHHSKLKLMAASLNCMINQEEINAELSRQGKESLDIKFIIDMQIYKFQNSIAPREYEDASDIVSTPDEMFAVVVLQSLQLLSYLTSDRDPTGYVRALSKISPQHLEYAILVFELLRFKTLSGEPLHDPYTSESFAHPSSDFANEITLISRVVSALPMSFSSTQWEAEVDEDLMGFNSIYKAFNRSLRNLVEMLCLSLYLRNKAKLEEDNYIKISLKLPFFQESNTAMGIVAKSFLQSASGSSQQLSESFPSCKQPVEDLKTAFKFFDETVEAVHVLHQSQLVGDDIRNLFDSSLTLLNQKRASLN